MREREKALNKRRRHIENIENFKSISVDEMNGEQFEYFLGNLFYKLGYKVNVTGITGDFGADLIIQARDGQKIAIQAKRYSTKVGIRAIQEISTAKSYYKVNATAVVTNNFYTDPAKKLAKTNNVILIDRNKLINLIEKSKQA